MSLPGKHSARPRSQERDAPPYENRRQQRLDPTRRSNDARDFEGPLRRRIVGQDAAVEKVVEIYQMFLAGLNPPGRPVGNLLFLGPTGSGKTRVVEAMAETLFGDARACIKIDCAEFQHSHEIAKLIGSPPGYLGHRETHPLLTQEALEPVAHREAQALDPAVRRNRKGLGLRSGSCCWAFWTKPP